MYRFFPQVLQTNGCLYHSPLPPMLLEPCKQQGLFAPRTLLRFFATVDPSDSLSSSAAFPVSPVIRFPAPSISGMGRGGSLQLLGVSLPSCCCLNPARVDRRTSQSATFHTAFAQRTRARPLGQVFSRPSAFTHVAARWLAHHP